MTEEKGISGMVAICSHKVSRKIHSIFMSAGFFPLLTTYIKSLMTWKLSRIRDNFFR